MPNAQCLMPTKVCFMLPRHFLLCLAIVVLAAGIARSQPTVKGTPTKLTLTPNFDTLRGARAAQQLMLTSTLPGGETRDLTRLARWSSSNPKVATVSADGYVCAVGNGTTVISAEYVFRTVPRTLKVIGADAP